MSVSLSKENISNKLEKKAFGNVDFGQILFGVVAIALIVFYMKVIGSCIVSDVTTNKNAIASNFDNVTDFGIGDPSEDHLSFLSNGVRYYYEPNKTIDGVDVINVFASDNSDDLIMTIDADTDKVIWQKGK